MTLNINKWPVRLTLKSMDLGGYFCGYASVFDVMDLQQDRVIPGAFHNTLKKWESTGKWPKMLWQHDITQPIGHWVHMDEDSQGLFVKGQLLLDIQKAQEAYTLMKAGVVDGLSIGFHSVSETFDAVHQCRILKDIDLQEISLVTYAANPLAKISDVKQQSSADASDLLLQSLQALTHLMR